MRSKKGEPGYLRSRKKVLTLFVLAGFGVAAALVVIGYRTTGSRLNQFTLAAALGCLPVCRALVNLIMLAPYPSINESRELEIAGASAHLTAAYDLVVTSEKRAMFIQALVISGQTVCGYSPDKRLNTEEASRYLQSMLVKNKFEKARVKIFKEYKKFLTRAEGMDSIVTVEKTSQRRLENAVRKAILEISM